MTNPGDRGWGAGWPNCQTSKIVPVEVPGLRIRAQEVHGDVETGFTFHEAVDLPAGLREEVAPLFTMLCLETQARGYDLVDGWCWGFSCRAVKGVYPLSPSFHSWGLAGDLNAPTNPMSSVLRTDMPAWMPALWSSYGWGWGGDYSGRKDAMHYEYLRGPDDAKRDTDKAIKEGIGTVLSLKQEQDLEWLEGFHAFFKGEKEPPHPGPKKTGWRNAERSVTEPKAPSH